MTIFAISAFLNALPLQSCLNFSNNKMCSQKARVNIQHRVKSTRIAVQASFTDDFFAGPSNPPRPRPLYQVVLFSLTTNLLWYGFYKYCVEEELRRETGEGLGGFLALSPFMVGICAPFYAPMDGTAQTAIAAALIWILTIQVWLYRRVNSLAEDRLEFKPLTPWWGVIPGFNFIVGLRCIHFLSVIWGADPEEDVIVDWFPFLGVRDLSFWKLLSTPSLWLKFFASKSDSKGSDDAQVNKTGSQD